MLLPVHARRYSHYIISKAIYIRRMNCSDPRPESKASRAIATRRVIRFDIVAKKMRNIFSIDRITNNALLSVRTESAWNSSGQNWQNAPTLRRYRIIDFFPPFSGTFPDKFFYPNAICRTRSFFKYPLPQFMNTESTPNASSIILSGIRFNFYRQNFFELELRDTMRYSFVRESTGPKSQGFRDFTTVKSYHLK